MWLQEMRILNPLHAPGDYCALVCASMKKASDMKKENQFVARFG
jgi:hypothetical protein